MKWVILFLLLALAVVAQDIVRSGNITLLALTESEGVKGGTVANLYLELRPGSERVFLETYPMTKVTTQASLRFAQQVACKQVEVDCSKYDFLFTIRALPGIVGGPSAGGAAALLTSALLLNKTVPDDLAMTGTINSGGIIGPVGGLKYKVMAAANNSIKRVFLPAGTKDVKEDDNTTVDLIQYGGELNLSVREVTTLGETLELALGVPQGITNDSLQIEGRYQRIMREVSDDLCQRTADFVSKPLKANLSSLSNFTERAARDQSQGAYYAAASYCFRANVDYKRAWYQEQNFSKTELIDKVKELKKEIDDVSKEFELRNISSLSDAQTLMAVMERVGDSKDTLDKVSEALDGNNTDVAGDVGYAEERLFSGITWARFFGDEQGIVVDQNGLKSVCISKISEAEERYNYVKSMIPEALDATREDIDRAYVLLGNGKYITCLYVASKSKAEADVLLSLIGVEEARFNEIINLKLDIARQALIKAQKKNIFPIIAYSYYEYANSLKDFDRISSLLFTEYALELSNLDIYFREEPPVVAPKPPAFAVPREVFIFVVGFGLGGLLFFALTRRKNPPANKISRKRRSSGRLF
jgi:uncharacterized protein